MATDDGLSTPRPTLLGETEKVIDGGVTSSVHGNPAQAAKLVEAPFSPVAVPPVSPSEINEVDVELPPPAVRSSLVITKLVDCIVSPKTKCGKPNIMSPTTRCNAILFITMAVNDLDFL